MDNPQNAIMITPISHTLDASVSIPGSKSLTNRALLIAALSEGTTRLTNALFSDDSLYFVEVLQQLGFDVCLDSARAEMTVSGLGGHIPAKKAELFIGNAGTAARFLTAFLTLGHGEYVLDGNSRMRERPIGELVTALTQLGANIRNPGSPIIDSQTLCLPITISASGLLGGHVAVAGNVSSQFLSGLLMIAPYAQNSVEITVTTELNSKPYVEMTLSVMSDFGVNINRDDNKRFIIQAARYKRREVYAIESDVSAASYFFAAAAILGGRVCVENISRRSKQGDVAFLDILREMGCTIAECVDYIEITGPVGQNLRGLDVDMCDISDTAQTLAAIAPFASSPTRIRGIASSRVKETDRIHAVWSELSRLGVDVQEHPDGLTIQPCTSICPTCVKTYNDHRMAMAFALIGLRVPGISIENPDCVSKTFPNYFEVLETLR